MKLKALWYCTKNKPYLIKNRFSGLPYLAFKELEQDVDYAPQLERIKLNGKIVAESDFEVEEITKVRNYYDMKPEAFDNLYYTRTLDCEQLSIFSCMTTEQFDNYLKDKNGYAIQIRHLNIFDKPKKISDFYKVENTYGIEPPRYLIKAPQNMCYVFDCYGNKYVLISARPEWLCLILNGKKDVELRRKVLKEMKE